MINLVLHDVLGESVHQVVCLEVLRGGTPSDLEKSLTLTIPNSSLFATELSFIFVQVGQSDPWVTRDCGLSFHCHDHILY